MGFEVNDLGIHHSWIVKLGVRAAMARKGLSHSCAMICCENSVVYEGNGGQVNSRSEHFDR